MKEHIKILMDLNACKEAIEWANQFDSFEQAWDACEKIQWMIWLYSHDLISISDRDLRLFACDCVLYSYDNIDTIGVAKRYANDMATGDELNEAWVTVCALTLAAARAAAKNVSAAVINHSAWAAEWYRSNPAVSKFEADLLRNHIGNPFAKVLL